jgi:signal transduction histidine kinase
MNKNQCLPGVSAGSQEFPPDEFAILQVPALPAPGDIGNDLIARNHPIERRARVDGMQDLRIREANENLILAILLAQDLQAAAEVANERQSEFLSMLAHELRNPLHPLGMANDVIGKILDSHKDLPKIHGIIQRQVAHLARLVDDLLDASRVNTGKISMRASVISLQDVIAAAVETSQPVITTRRQHLELDFPAQAIFVNGDLTRLTQVFSNLLLNASKYTPELGHLIIRVTPQQARVEVAVIDDGAGVPLEIQPFIFDLFVQGPRPQVPAQSGLGIGLSLVRSIVQQHGGMVHMSSAGSGTGSQFIVNLAQAAGQLPC